SNTLPVQAYVDRLRAAEALVLVHPVWNFGFPAMMKGFFDRVFLPGVSFGMVEGRARGSLTNIKRVVIVTTYGATPWRAFMAGDPPKRFAKRVMRAMTQMKAPVGYLAHYDMNRSTPATRADFLQKVRDCFRSF
ncbi:MAG: NAD(P)H-dependent oxidoreductase, partial [Alphaproteobacteria bacterium]